MKLIYKKDLSYAVKRVQSQACLTALDSPAAIKILKTMMLSITPTDFSVFIATIIN